MSGGSYEAMLHTFSDVVFIRFPYPLEVTGGAYIKSGSVEHLMSKGFRTLARPGIITWYFATPMQVSFLFPYPRGVNGDSYRGRW